MLERRLAAVVALAFIVLWVAWIWLGNVFGWAALACLLILFYLLGRLHKEVSDEQPPPAQEP